MTRWNRFKMKRQRRAEENQRAPKKALTPPCDLEIFRADTRNTKRLMRTKTLLLSALACAAGVSAASAQVYSVNAVGYVNVDLPVGYSMISNPLDTEDNTVAGLFPDGTLPNFSQILKWNGTGFDVATFAFGAWDTPGMTLELGEGAFVNVDTATTVTFVGEVAQGTLSTPIPAGYSIKSSQVPQAGGLEALGLSASLSDFDQVLKWNGSGYELFTYSFGAWSPSEPSVDVAESFFVNAGSATSWDRNFDVNAN